MKKIKVKIRKANQKDVNSIVELAKKLIEYHRRIDKIYRDGESFAPLFRRYLRREMKKPTTIVLVAEIEKKIIGYFMAKITKPKRAIFVVDKMGLITDAFIEKEFRRKRVGEKIFRELIRWFKKKKIKHIELSVNSRNTIGINAWKKFGFQEVVKKMRLTL